MKTKIILLLLFTIGLQNLKAQQLTLEQCVEKALVNNKKLKIDQNNITISLEKQKEIKSNLYPKLHATLDYKYFFDLPTQLMPAKAFNPMAPEWQFNAAQFGVPHNINTNIQLGMPLYNSELYGGIKATKIATKLKKLQFQKSKEDVYQTVSNLYYSAQIIKNQIAFIDKNIQNSNNLLQNLKLLKQQLLVTGTDVNKIDLQIKQLETQRQLLQSKYKQIINALKITMGINSDFDVNEQIENIALISYEPKTITDIKMLKTKQELTYNEIKTLKKNKIPTVTLYGSYGQTGYGYDKKPNDFLNWYPLSFIGLKVDIPVLDLSQKRKIKQKLLESENSKLQLELLSEQNNIEIENAQEKRNVASLTIKNTKNQIDLAQQIYNQTLLQHKQEVASLTDVLLADNNLRQAQQNYITAVIDYLKADLELKKRTGNLNQL